MIVRNGSQHVGIDWRVVASVVGVLISVIAGLLVYGSEREQFAAHISNRGEYRHLTQEERDEVLVGTRYELRMIRAQLTAIAKQVGVDTTHGVGAAIVPRGQED